MPVAVDQRDRAADHVLQPVGASRSPESDAAGQDGQPRERGDERHRPTQDGLLMCASSE